MYATYHYRGSKVNIPKYIKYIALYMPDWFAEKYPDEVAPILAHELAHHELNTKTGSLRHSKAHTRLTKTLEQAIMRSLA
jgi:predicted SprT family Zn-dependent metalloprotease